METFYVTHDQFWDWFDREEEQIVSNNSNQITKSPSAKRLKTDNKPRTIYDTEAAVKVDARYVILYGPHKPGKKNKIWEGDGYLTLVGQTAHLCDLRGRMLEEPTILDDLDYKVIKDCGELTIGNTEVQVIELDT